MIQSINSLTGGQPLRARIVTWELSGINVRHATLVAALEVNGLDPKVAREICTTDAFRRAIHKLSDERVIRKLREDKDYIQFQFTKWANIDGERIDYNFEAVVTLDKSTGKITCDVPEIETRAQSALDASIENRTTGDVTRIVQRLFESDTDLFPIRKRGGAYLVVEEKAALCDKVDSFLKSINGELTQFSIVADNASCDKSIKETVASGLNGIATELRKKIEGLSEKNTNTTLAKRAQEINELRYKLDGYAAYLDVAREELELEIDSLLELLENKIASIAEAKSESSESQHQERELQFA